MSDEQDKKLDEVVAATFDWGKFFSTPTGKAIGALAIAFFMMASSWITDKVNHQPPVINIVPSNDNPPIVPSVKAKFSVYVTEKTKTIPNDPSLAQFGLMVDSKVYSEGLSYKIGNVMTPLPCVVLVDSDGRAVSAATFEKASDIAEFCKKGK